MMASDTLKTPSDTQWRKLCEMAGWEVKTKINPGHGTRMFLEYPTGGHCFLDFLPHNTDALMRLMGELCERYTHTFDTGRATITALLRSNLMAITSAGIDIDPGRAFRLAACDILAQLAEAEGIQ